MSNYPLYGQNQYSPYQQVQQIQQMFPQPQGSVYAINTPIEVGNVPIGSTGLSVAICFNEQLMYIKSFQNGNPVIMAYRVLPYTKEETPTQTNTSSTAGPSGIDLGERLDRLERTIKSIAENRGKFDGLL